MGRKKRKKRDIEPFCYYCNRKFPTEKVLIQHQKAKHFKCQICPKKMSTALALMNHMFQVHKESLKKVPNAKTGRDQVDLNIYGMQGIPQAIVDERAAKKKAKQDALDAEKAGANPKAPAPAAAAAVAAPPAQSPQVLAQQQMMQQQMMMGMPGMPHMQMMQMPGMHGGMMMMPMPGMPMGRGVPTPMMGRGMGRGMPAAMMGRGMPNPMGRGMTMTTPGMGRGMMPSVTAGGVGKDGLRRGLPPATPPPTPIALTSGAPTTAIPAGEQPVGADFKPLKKAEEKKEDTKNKKSKVIFIYKDANGESMEEKRAQLAKYKYSETSITEDVDRLSSSIQARFKQLEQVANEDIFA